uniref:SAND domain-containing protein n=1 Tax=Myripristis murdjan TaxID=586833 RepID=A0A667YP41_9TELE
MAGAEVTASSGDVIMVKEEEGESSGTHKTEVILHLQPILHGINDDIADTDTRFQADGEEIEYGYPITCGDSRAVLLFKKFVCPGINVRCVKFNDQLISPKQFVHLAGKATLKDWKRAIRLGGVMLRKMMDSGQIDFYQHDTVCTNTCRSTKFDVLINSTRLPSSSSVPPTSSGLTADPLGGKLAPMPGRFQMTVSCSLLTFLWKGVADIGLMGEVLSSIQTELVATLKEVEVRSERHDYDYFALSDAMMLNSLCEMFGLLDSVKQALDLRRSQSEENRAHSALYVLDGNLEVQRKQGYDKSTSYRNMSSKRLRLHRRSPSASQTQSQHQASQSTLCPITGSPVIQPLTVAALSAASLAQLTVSPELFTRFSASVSTGHRHHAGIICGADRMDREGQHVEPEREHGVSLHSLGQEEDTSGSHTALRTAGAREEDSHLIGEQVEELERLYDINRVVVGRKASKKHKIQ